MKSDIRWTAETGCSAARPFHASATGLKSRSAARRIRFAGLFLLVLFIPIFCGAEKKPETAKKNPAQVAPAPVAHPDVHPVVADVHPPVAKASDNKLAPLPPSDKVVAYHPPYDAGDCSICHKNKDPQNPGPLAMPVNDLCLSCHDDFTQTLASKSVHPPAKQSCVNCHNPHNSTQAKLLLAESGALCMGCHKEIKKAALESPVKHDAVLTGRQCLNCHNPHGANVEHLLVQLPMQLCMQCHGKDDVTDHNGKTLSNMATVLANNPFQHGPVAAQDCSACHMPHGSDNFRLLTSAYPPKFYSPYDSKNYALCFGCHDEKAFTVPETEELTQFRNGSKNLHYVHVHRDITGRTCRACHEVHAAPQEHQIRNEVPYGTHGWMLKINYTKTATGGSCAKTCHATRWYNNTLKDSAPVEAAAPAAVAPVANAPAANAPNHDAKP